MKLTDSEKVYTKPSPVRSANVYMSERNEQCEAIDINFVPAHSPRITPSKHAVIETMPKRLIPSHLSGQTIENEAHLEDLNVHATRFFPETSKSNEHHKSDCQLIAGNLRSLDYVGYVQRLCCDSLRNIQPCTHLDIFNISPVSAPEMVSKQSAVKDMKYVKRQGDTIINISVWKLFILRLCNTLRFADDCICIFP